MKLRYGKLKKLPLARGHGARKEAEIFCFPPHIACPRGKQLLHSLVWFTRFTITRKIREQFTVYLCNEPIGEQG